MMFTEDNGVSSSGHVYHNKKLSVLSIALVFISILVFQLLALVNALYALSGEGRSLVVQLFPLIGKKYIKQAIVKV